MQNKRYTSLSRKTFPASPVLDSFVGPGSPGALSAALRASANVDDCGDVEELKY